MAGARIAVAIFGFCVAMLISRNVAADEADARNFLTIATGSTPSSNDPRISIVQRQLEMIEHYCAATSSGPGIHDQLGFAHSQLKVQQSLLTLLTDFVRIARAQCSQVSSTTLVTLYVLERNSGASHFSAIEGLMKNPKVLLARWKSR